MCPSVFSMFTHDSSNRCHHEQLSIQVRYTPMAPALNMETLQLWGDECGVCTLMNEGCGSEPQ